MKHRPTTNWKSSVYALLSQTNPDILTEIHFKTTKNILVAAQLIKTNSNATPQIFLHNNEGTRHQFDLDISSSTFISKGNWMWVKQVEIYYPAELVLDIQVNPRVIDIPYAYGNRVCAHWLIRHLHTDVVRHFQANHILA